MVDTITSSELFETLLEQDKMFHDNQTSAGNEILEHFANDSRYVQLSAQMQSGKTGCALFCAFDMLFAKKVDRVFIISGSSETELRKQWTMKVPQHLVEFCKMRKITDKDNMRRINKIIADGIIWRQNLLKSTEQFTDRYLIIWDESHFATTEDQTLHTFLDTVGLMSVIQGDTSVLRAKNSYILSVTATRCAEHSRFCGANDGVSVKDWKMVVMTPGNTYRGVKQLVARGLVKCSYPINEDTQAKIEAIIRQYQHLRKYMVIRCQSKDEGILEEIATKIGIGVMKYNMETNDRAKAKRAGQDVIDVSNLDTRPGKFTLVLIRGMLRMGKELPKQHVCAVYEPGSSKNNTTLQGLLGRACGYYSREQEDIDVYIPNAMDNRALQEYIAVIDSGFTKGISGTLHIPHAPKGSINPERYTNVPFRIRMSDAGPDQEFTIFRDPSVSCSDVKKCFPQYCSEILTIIEKESCGFSKSHYTPEQLTEIRSFLRECQPNDNRVMCSFTHKNGKLKATTNNDGQMRDLSKALEIKTPITKYNGRKSGMINFAMVISRVNGTAGLEDEEYSQLKCGDFIVTFNTNESTNEQFQPSGSHATYGKDIFHTDQPVKEKTSDIEKDGFTKSYLPECVKTQPEKLRECLRKEITKYLAQEQPCLLGGNTIYKQCFKKEQYKNVKWMAQLFKGIENEKEFRDRVKIDWECVGRGRPPVNEEGCIRFKYIRWKTK